MAPGSELWPLIQEEIQEAELPGGERLPVLPVRRSEAVAWRADVEQRLVELTALRHGVVPARYLRNLKALSLADQLRLMESRAALVGLGGLGGHLAEFLARMGVGRILGADFDLFEDSNLNRQLLCTTDALGHPKADAAEARLRQVNPAVAFKAHQELLDEEAMALFFQGADLAIDCLGGLAHRTALERAAARAEIPLVTGAMAGDTGYVAVVLPGAPGPASLMGDGEGAENELGTQAPAVALTASLMAREALRLLLGKASPLAGKMMLFDLEGIDFQIMDLPGGPATP